MNQVDSIKKLPIQKLLLSLSEIFGDRFLVGNLEIMTTLNEDDLRLLFPKMRDNDLGDINDKLSNYYWDALDRTYFGDNYLLHTQNFNHFLIDSILDILSSGNLIKLGDLTDKIETLIMNNTGISELEIYNGQNCIKLSDLILEAAKSDNRIKVLETTISEKETEFVFQLNHFSIININNAIEDYLASSPDFKITIRALLNKLNSSPDLYQDFKKPIELSKLREFIIEESNYIFSESNGVLSFPEDHPIRLYNEFLSKKLSYYQLLSLAPKNSYTHSTYQSGRIINSAIFGIFIKNNQIFGQEFSEFLSTFPLIYVGSSDAINEFLVGGEIFNLKEDNEFAINLLTLLLHNKQAPIDNARIDLTFIKNNLEFAYNLRQDSIHGLIKFCKPLLNLKNNPDNPFLATIWELKEKYKSEIKSLMHIPNP